MKYYKYLISSLIIIIIVLTSMLVYTKYFEEKIIFTLFGDDEIILYENDEYLEYGFVAVSESGKNLNSEVKIKSNLDTSKVGKYKIEYSIRKFLKTYKGIRKINVLENDLQEVEFTLKGSSIVNLEVGNEYLDPKFTCIHKESKKDLSSYVVIENLVNNQKEGEYEIIYRLIYNGKEKRLKRKVYVFEQKNSHTINTTALTNKPVSISFQSNIHNFSHVICPNETIRNSNKFTYNFFENGKYTFYIVDSLNNYEEYIVTINNIDRTPPTGTCEAILLDGKTTYSVKTNDTDIDKYLYNSEEKYASLNKNYIASKYQRDAKVLLLDKAGNKTEVLCIIKRTYKKPLDYLEQKDIKYSSKTDTLIVNMMEKDGYYLTHLWIKDPYLQVNKEMIKESSKTLQAPRKILEQAVNKYNLNDKLVWSSSASAPVLKGSFYSALAKKSPMYNLKEPSALLVYNGKIIINDYKDYAANTVIYYINESNELSYIPIMASNDASYRKVRFEKALESGIRNTFAFNMILVKDGVAQTTGNDYYALRSGFCQLDENNFLSVVSDTKRWNRQDFANYMQSLGCKLAVNFDGGGSVALFYKEKNNKNIMTLAGNQRALSSVLYVTELD